MKYGYTKKVDYGFEEAVEETKKILSEQCFGVLTTIDVQAKMKEKLGKNMEEYIILGACNPEFAYKALTKEISIGLLLPCNIIIYKKLGVVYVSTILPRFCSLMLSLFVNFKPTNSIKKIKKSLKYDDKSVVYWYI